MLTNTNALERLLYDKPTIGKMILSFFGKAAKDYADVPKLSGQAKRYYRAYKRMFDALAERNAQNNANEADLTLLQHGQDRFALPDAFVKDKYYDRQVDGWEKLQSGGYITVGVILEKSPISQVGIPSGKLYFDISKLHETLKSHNDHLTTDSIKDIPKILNNPVVITKFDNNTINVFGEVVIDKSPVMVGIVISKGRGSQNIVSKVRTIHARRDSATLITDNRTLYLGENKKRTTAWFQALGIKVPLGGTRFGFIKSISQHDYFVNPEEKKSFALPLVEAVQPTSDAWKPSIDTAEAKKRFPQLWDVAAEESDVRNPTQVKGTVLSYRKVYARLKAEEFDGRILDASSGLGEGTRVGRSYFGFDVDDIEPYPDKSYKPKYTDYSKLHEKYDVIISNAVLNVLPQDQRDALVVKMGELLADGGRMFINVRGDDVRNASSKVAINEEQMEYYISQSGSYQKGFTKSELVAYLRDALGDGYTVASTSFFGKVSAIVTKNMPIDNSNSFVYDLGEESSQNMTEGAKSKNGRAEETEEFPSPRDDKEGSLQSNVLRYAGGRISVPNNNERTDRGKVESVRRKYEVAGKTWERLRETQRINIGRIFEKYYKFFDENTASQLFVTIGGIKDISSFFYGIMKTNHEMAEMYKTYFPFLEEMFTEYMCEAVRDVSDIQNMSESDLDQAYFTAISDNDMEKIRSLVYSKAELNGFGIHVFHGTDGYGFTEFNTISANEPGFHVGTYLQAKGFVHSESRNSGIYDLLLNPGRSVRVPDVFAHYASFFDYVQMVHGDKQRTIFDEIINTPDEFPKNKQFYSWAKAVQSTIAKGSSRTISDMESANILAQEYIKSLGYDSLVYTNLAEGAGGDSYLVTEKRMVKSADLITYDDEGKVIPLSKRFSEDDDIRFAMPIYTTDSVGVDPRKQYKASLGDRLFTGWTTFKIDFVDEMAGVEHYLSKGEKWRSFTFS